MNKAENSPIKKANIYFIGIVAAIFGLLFGFDIGIISGAQKFLLHTFNIQNNTLYDNFLNGFTVASVLIGALVGVMVSRISAKNFGHKQSILLTAALIIIGTLIAVFSMNLNMLIADRLVIGCAIGLSVMVAPMYLGEILPPEVRGTIIFSFQLAITIGLFSTFGINLWFSKIMTNPTANCEAVGQLAVLFLLTSKWLKLPSSVDYNNKKIMFTACTTSSCHQTCRPCEVFGFSTSVKRVKAPFRNKVFKTEAISLAFALKQ